MPTKLLLPILSSAATITLGFLLIGALYRAPDFFSSPRFLLPLVGCSIASALLLLPYRGANWAVRVVLAPPIAIILFFLVILAARIFAA